MRIAIAAAIACLSIVGMTATAQVQAAARKHTEIPAESLDIALRALAKDRGFQLVYLTENVASLKTRGASGELTVDEALKKLLSDSRLEYRFVDENTVSIFPKSNDTSKSGLDLTHAGGDNSSRTTSKSSEFRVAQVDQGTNVRAIQLDGTAPNAEASPSGSGHLSEIIVTAQKKSERLQDVPVPVTVLNADQLADSGQVLLRDYAASVPGFRVTPSGQGYQYLSIRGIVTGGTVVPTVGVMIDDVPFGPSTTNGSGVPDIDPGDLSRIEVLRGPQGTLYGANSIGGLLKFVTKDPSTDAYSGRIEAGTQYVRNGAEPGYNMRASANLPISDTFAMRISGFTRQDAGYIDNPVLNIEGIDRSVTDGARWVGLWRPTEALSLRLSALYQDTNAHGVSQVTLGLGDLQQSFPAGIGGYDRSVEAYSATLDYKIGKATLTSVTGFNVNHFRDSLDLTYAYGPFAVKDFGVAGAGLFDDFLAHKFTQELRLDMPVGTYFDWLVGAFFTNESVHNHQVIGAVNATTGGRAGVLGNIVYPNTYKEYAGFTDLTWHVTDRFDVQLGGRESQLTVANDITVSTGPLFVPSPTITPPVESKANAFTYLLTPSFKLSSDLMVYARLASGYRPGGPNSSLAVSNGATPGFEPDKTRNYEIGLKGSFLDHLLTVDTSIYYVDWKNIQLKLDTAKQYGYQGNGGSAKSEGVEFSVVANPVTGLTVSAWIDYDDAVITDVPPLTPIYLYPGDPLAYNSRFTGNLSVQQEFALWRGATGFLGGQADYVGNRLGIFTTSASAPRKYYPGYTQVDLRAGTRLDSAWTINLYANNVADKRGLIGANFSPPTAVIYIPPRTIGISVAKAF